MKLKRIAALVLAVAAVAFAGCASSSKNDKTEEDTGFIEREDPEITAPPVEEDDDVKAPAEIEIPGVEEEEEPPKAQTVKYIRVTANNVNIRSGAGTSYSVTATAEKDTLYAYEGETNGWYKTTYRNKTVYISSKYCVLTEMEASGDERIEAVIAEGTKLLGTPYVYGAVRLHDGTGRFLSGFTTNAFDCSSLMQYMFYYGADYILQVNTRTQVYQGKTVSKADLQRGDLMFFTNSSRYNKTGVERIGHVAIYLGDNYILHTASDYAKIEQISTQRWNYFIQAQRIL